jgi:hypothetical protein
VTASFAIEVGTWGVIAANALFVSVRLFARSQGLKVRWWSRSYAPERELLRRLTSSTDAGLARRARGYLRVEISAWLVFGLSVIVFLWGVASR